MQNADFVINNTMYFINRGTKQGINRDDLSDIRRTLEVYFNADQLRRFNDVIRMYEKFDLNLFGLLDEVLVAAKNKYSEVSENA